jgi:hypothetical protein
MKLIYLFVCLFVLAEIDTSGIATGTNDAVDGHTTYPTIIASHSLAHWALQSSNVGSTAPTAASFLYSPSDASGVPSPFT